MVAPVLN